jgi:hypothetical protein
VKYLLAILLLASTVASAARLDYRIHFPELSILTMDYPDTFGSPSATGSEEITFRWILDPIQITSYDFAFDISSEVYITSLAFGSFVTYGMDSPTDGTVKLSDSVTNVTYTLTDLDSGQRLVEQRSDDQMQLGVSFDSLAMKSVRFETHIDFIGGNWLAASADNSCTSFDCLTPAKRTMFLREAEIMLTVPEPGTYLLVGAGLLALVTVRSGFGSRASRC